MRGRIGRFRPTVWVRLSAAGLTMLTVPGCNADEASQTLASLGSDLARQLLTFLIL